LPRASRNTQNLLSERTWEFKSTRPHQQSRDVKLRCTFRISDCSPAIVQLPMGPIWYAARAATGQQICPEPSIYGSVWPGLIGPISFGHLAGSSATKPMAQRTSCPLRLRSHPASGALGAGPHRSELPSPIGLRLAHPHKFASRDGAGRASEKTASAKGARQATARRVPAASVLRATAGRARPLARSTATNRFSASWSSTSRTPWPQPSASNR